MRSEKRKSKRKPLRYSAWIHVQGEIPKGCSVNDISETGARLEFAAPQDLPDRFSLLLSKNGAARRSCLAVWRTDSQVGVQFEKSDR